MRSRSQLVRRSVAAVAGVMLAAGAVGVAGALQASASPDGTRVTEPSGGAPASVVAVAQSLTIKSDKATAKAWTTVSLTGKATGIAANTTVQVQRLESGKWVNFPATTKVTSKGTYSVWVKSGRVGVNKFRVVAAKAASPAVSVNITK